MLKVKKNINEIPKNTPYCYEPISLSKDGVLMTKPCKYWVMKYNKEYECKMEYCKYLKAFLDIQDQVKDCEIE